MATVRDMSIEFEPPLWGDDRLKAEVYFNGYHGWEWLIQHRVNGCWYVLDSGLSSSWNAAIHQAQRVIGELDATSDAAAE